MKPRWCVPMTFTLHARARLVVNGSTGWRCALGAALSRMASRLDKRDRLALQFETVPALSHAQRVACINAGIDAMARAAHTEARCDAMDNAMRTLRPELFE
jgi:hypothetical protein